MNIVKFFLAEDDAIRNLEKLVLDLNGYMVVAEAASLTEALANITKAFWMGANIALLDANLTKGIIAEEGCKSDGEIIAEALRKTIPGIIIISCSNIPDQEWGDINLHKMDIATLGDVIENI